MDHEAIELLLYFDAKSVIFSTNKKMLRKFNSS